MLFSIIIYLNIVVYLNTARGSVLELNDKFLEATNYGPWLVKFYAPWCGFCRRLEPIYEQVARVLTPRNIKVARIDATIYSTVAATYDVRGYPTLKYINGSVVYTHSGDRTVDNIVEFVVRSSGPALRFINNTIQFSEMINTHHNSSSFLYIGPLEGQLFNTYKELAEVCRLKSYFYASESINSLDRSKSFMSTFLSSIQTLPLVTVVKDEMIITAPESALANLPQSLHQWILMERFSSFPKLSEIDLYEFIDSNHHVALLVVNGSHLLEPTTNIERTYFQHMKNLAKSRLDKFQRKLQFGYMVDMMAANNLAMTYLSTPNIIVVEPGTNKFYLRNDYLLPMSEQSKFEEIEAFLSDVLEGKVEGYGGNGFVPKLKRASYDFVTGLAAFISSSPGLAMIVLGVPIAVVSFLCYAICCMDMSGGDEDLAQTRAMRRMRQQQNHLMRSSKVLHEYSLRGVSAESVVVPPHCQPGIIPVTDHDDTDDDDEGEDVAINARDDAVDGVDYSVRPRRSQVDPISDDFPDSSTNKLIDSKSKTS